MDRELVIKEIEKYVNSYNFSKDIGVRLFNMYVLELDHIIKLNKTCLALQKINKFNLFTSINISFTLKLE